MRSSVACAVLAAMPLFTAWPSTSQVPSLPPFERFPSTGGTFSTDRPLSAAVIGSWIARVSPDRTASLDLLVLWRGAPGWFTRGQGGGMTAGGGGGSRETQTIVQRLSYGGVSFEVELTIQGADRRLRLQGREVPLNGGNIVLVDRADSPQPTVIAARSVDPAMTDPNRIFEILRRSRELVSFLRCETPFPDPLTQRYLGLTCAEVSR